MSWRNSPVRYRADVVPPDARPGDRRNQYRYYFESTSYWEARRHLNAIFGNRWEHLTEDR